MKSLLILFYFVFSTGINAEPIVNTNKESKKCKKTKALKTINEKKVFETTFVYEFDENGREVRHDLYWEDGSRKWAFQKMYNKKGLLQSMARFDEENNYDGYYHFNLDDNGFKIKETIFDKNGKVLNTKKYKNNSDGNPVRYDYYNGNNEMTEYWTFEYDKNGNNIKKSIFTSGGMLNSYFLMQYDENNLEQSYVRYSDSGEEMYTYYFTYDCEG